MKYINKKFIKATGYTLVVLSFIYSVSLFSVNVMIKSKLKSFEENGRDTSAEAFSLNSNDRVTLPDDENAALIYKCARRALHKDDYKRGTVYGWINKLSEKSINYTASEDEVAELREIFKRPVITKVNSLLVSAVEKERCQFKVSINDDDSLNLKHLMLMKRLGNMLYARALLNKGDDAETMWADLILNLQVNEALKAEDGILQLATRNHQFVRAVRLMITRINHSKPSQEQKAAIEEILQRFESKTPFERGLDAELISAKHFVFGDDLQHIQRMMSKEVKFLGVYRSILRPLYHLDYLAYLSYNEYCYEALDRINLPEPIEDYKIPFYAKLTREMVSLNTYTYEKHGENIRCSKELRTLLEE